MLKIDWTRIKESLHNLSETSGASTDYVRGNLVGIVATLSAIGFDFKRCWPEIIKNMPDDLRVKGIPTPFLNLNGFWTFDDKDVVTFKDLLDVIPEDMRKQPYEDYDWTCRDAMLDRYLYIMSIFQRETDREFQIWNSDLNGDPAYKPKLVYTFAPFRKSGSQYIAEWAITDLRKEHKELINWHGQNTSRWLYAGCLLVQNGRVSIHT